MKFDTGLPNCVCLDVIMNLTLPTQKSLIGEQEDKSYYQGNVTKAKLSRLRQTTVNEEYLLVLC